MKLDDIIYLSYSKITQIKWKLRLNDTYVIEFPIQVCEPLNADFDGDTVSIQDESSLNIKFKKNLRIAGNINNQHHRKHKFYVQ